MRIEGVYESQVPLMFRALLTFGSSCRLKPTLQANSAVTYNFEQLEPVGIELSYFPTAIIDLARALVKMNFLIQIFNY